MPPCWGREAKRQAFIERLGPEADEVIDELLSRALEFEKSQTPNLQAFLAAMRQGGAEIKRDMGAANDQIRVMTVHGSKGLEAPIVFLVDSSGKPASPHHHPHLVRLPAEEGSTELMVWKAAKANQPGLVTDQLARLDRAAEEEYLRLLYVGMTRAEDRLYLCGYQGMQAPAENCWYQVARRRLEGAAQEVTHPVTGETVLQWQLDAPFAPRAAGPATDRTEPANAPLPDWFHAPFVDDAPALPVLQPSRAR